MQPSHRLVTEMPSAAASFKRAGTSPLIMAEAWSGFVALHDKVAELFAVSLLAAARTTGG